MLQRILIRSLVTLSKMQRKLDRAEVAGLLQHDVLQLCDIFLKQNYEIRLVGGCVRDILFQQSPKDIDLSTTATPHQMIELFKENNVRYIETGLQHGTLTAHFNSKDYEITTLRIDVETYGRAAKVQFTNDWRLDAERRDLTFNAMSLDVDGNLYDYFGGEKDLKEGKVRFVGDPELRIREDYLRILRYFRFYGRIAPNISNHEEKTLAIIETLSPGLDSIAAERIWMEVAKVLTGKYAPHLIRLMYQLNVAKHISLPQCSEERFVEFENVWKRCDLAHIQPVVLLTALVNEETQAKDLTTKWKLSNFQKLLSCFVAKHRYMKIHNDYPLKAYQDIVVRNNNQQTFDMTKQLLYYEGKIEEIEQMEQWEIPKFPITGVDLKKKGVKPGPEFGKLFNQLKDEWIKSQYTLTQEFLCEEISRLQNK